MKTLGSTRHRHQCPRRSRVLTAPHRHLLEAWSPEQTRLAGTSLPSVTRQYTGRGMCAGLGEGPSRTNWQPGPRALPPLCLCLLICKMGTEKNTQEGCTAHDAGAPRRPRHHCTAPHHRVSHRRGPQTAQHRLQSGLSPAPGSTAPPLSSPRWPSTPTRPAQSSLRACRFWPSSSSLRKQTIPWHRCELKRQEGWGGPAPGPSPTHSRGSVRLGSAQLPTVAPWEPAQNHELRPQTWCLSEHCWASIFHCKRRVTVYLRKLLWGSQRW